jgi:hypothetical protein
MDKKRLFISAFRMALVDQMEGGIADEAKPQDFDIKSLLKGILVELEHTNNPIAAMEIAMDHLAEHAEYYDALELMEKELESDDDDDDDDDDDEGEPAPDQIASKLIDIADLIDKSNSPSKTRIVKRLKAIQATLKRHPHLSCQECGTENGKEHCGWCPLG